MIKFEKTKINGLLIGNISAFKDQRGTFKRIFSKDIFSSKLKIDIKQANICENPLKGTFRGLHFQTGLRKEDKVIHILNGKTFHIILDMRKKSKTFKKVFTYTLSKGSHNFLVIPKDCAHGYLTLKKNSVILYFVSNYYSSTKSKGVSIYDPVLKSILKKINKKIKKISDNDKSWPKIKF